MKRASSWKKYVFNIKLNFYFVKIFSSSEPTIHRRYYLYHLTNCWFSIHENQIRNYREELFFVRALSSKIQSTTYTYILCFVRYNIKHKSDTLSVKFELCKDCKLCEIMTNPLFFVISAVNMEPRPENRFKRI
jgi:hypothetical protein